VQRCDKRSAEQWNTKEVHGDDGHLDDWLFIQYLLPNLNHLGGGWIHNPTQRPLRRNYNPHYHPLSYNLFFSPRCSNHTLKFGQHWTQDLRYVATTSSRDTGCIPRQEHLPPPTSTPYPNLWQHRIWAFCTHGKLAKCTSSLAFPPSRSSLSDTAFRSCLGLFYCRLLPWLSSGDRM
jgi:hypothetical protein